MALIERRSIIAKAMRAFGVTQSGFGATVSDEVVPVTVLEDMSGPGLSQEYPRNASRSIILPVGISSAQGCIFNPANSGVAAIVNHIRIEDPAFVGNNWNLRAIDAGDFAGFVLGGTGEFDDAELNLTSGSALQFGLRDGVPLGTTWINVATNIDGAIRLDDVGYVVKPGFGLNTENTFATGAFNVTYRWTEHLIGDGQVE